ncbi:unnamed protein product [Rhizophagus irregularis]|uniref:MULE transposase domain-containing protein n=1 Tax=Rhizophagus irregularis TaxID=588596 RepID=A0A915YPF5_9GLOM|nr:unnamed protein product [Rhizophagus irregularis]
MNKENSKKVPNFNEKICTRYSCKKKKADFCRSRGINQQNEYSTCNKCYERRKNTRKEIDPISRKKLKLEDGLIVNTPVPHQTNIDSSRIPFTHLTNLELDNITQDQHNDNIDECNDEMDGLLYGLSEIQEIISKRFQDAENLNEPVKLTFEIELDSRLVECTFPEFQPDISDIKAIKENFHQLANILILPLEYGSGYYWEIRKIHLITNKKKFTGCAMIYLGCTQREDRQWQRPENLPVKRRSEAHAPINRYSCMGNIVLTIDPQQQHILVQGSHQQAHEHPQYRKVAFPEAAKQWIQNNIKYNLRNPELYKRLQYHELIDAQIHTKEQVYYWASVFSKDTYIFNSENQLLSAKEYLKEKLNFKTIYYLENDFIKALGFTTPLLNRIGITNLKEIIVDSTFKTNQERFELFVVNANCGGYGMPIAYLYLLTCNGTTDAYNDPKNQVNTRVQALCEFFTSLRNEGLLPTFVLIDKDAGEISAIEEAWSWTVNLQLCYWHLEHAIERRLKDKKSKSTGYSKNKAIEAHQQFDFIESTWIPTGCAGSLCPDDKIKEIINIVKRHAIMHPLIPVAKNTFWNSAQIYQYCVQEAYQFCHSNNLSKLWGYLWINWYNRKDWKLFARSAYSSAMPLARTTMITESHWRVPNIIIMRHHDYPLVSFGADKISSICQENDPWERYVPIIIEDYLIKESHPSSSNLQSIELAERNSAKDEIEVKLTHYEKIFNLALVLYQREKNNTHFVKSFDSLMKPVVKAIEECEKKLGAHTQQSTWSSKSGKLAFWLR